MMVCVHASSVEQALKAQPAVAAAWIFGSVARGEARDDSDLDVAVLLGDPQANELTLRRELMALAAQIEKAAGRPVDLVVLGLHDPILAHRVLSDGQLIYDADSERRIEFTSDALARYFDWAPSYEAAAARSLAVNREWAKKASR